MLEFITNRNEFYSELFDEIRNFVPDYTSSDIVINHCYVLTDKITNRIDISGDVYSYETPICVESDQIVSARLLLRGIKLALYKALERHFGRSLPWGSLTGIRPTALAYQMLAGGTETAKIADELAETFLVTSEKAKIVQDIVVNQIDYTQERMSLVYAPPKGELDIIPVTEPMPKMDKTRLVNLYVHIPFCTSRCVYCSFVSTTIDKQKWLVQPYVDALVREIKRTRQMLDERGYQIFSVYVGGGTPSALDERQLLDVLDAARCDNVEYTCEAGRPDTITAEKLHVMANCGVNRISVNPQTLNDKTLKIIGRNHTVDEFYKAYEMAKSFGFRKNVDLIAGLEGENLDDFIATVNGVLSLKPENITVHTLSRKRGAKLIDEKYESNDDIENMVNYSTNAMSENGYIPYYLYRQKQMLGNLENIGFCLPNFQCVNNITTMEEQLSVVACGAGAISKRVFASNRIERLANVKDIILYLKQFEERLDKKLDFFE